MSSAVFYVDESGDMGWNFAAPYRRGGSSRHLTIATLVCPSEARHFPKRLIVDLYKRFRWDPKAEMKWSLMSREGRVAFAQRTLDMLTKHGGIKLFAITVYKPKVADHIKKDSNKLYNYMIGLSLLDEMENYDTVTLVPDQRSIKVQSGNSLHDYLGINLAFERNVATELLNFPCDSACSKSVQFADMFAGLVQCHYEDSNSECWQILNGRVSSKRLFFP